MQKALFSLLFAFSTLAQAQSLEIRCGQESFENSFRTDFKILVKDGAALLFTDPVEKEYSVRFLSRTPTGALYQAGTYEFELADDFVNGLPSEGKIVLNPGKWYSSVESCFSVTLKSSRN